MSMKNPMIPSGIEPATYRFVAQHLNHCATATPLIFVILRIFMMTINLFIIADIKQLRTDGSFRILLPFFRTSWGVGVLNSAIFDGFHNRVEFGTIFGGLRNFGREGGRGLKPPPPLGTPMVIADNF